MPRKIEVVDYRPEWESMFKEEEKKIKKILAKTVFGVYHIGSTSVKNMPAKPVIDIMPVVKDLSLVDSHSEIARSPRLRMQGRIRHSRKKILRQRRR